jgi:hypothetical protein
VAGYIAGPAAQDLQHRMTELQKAFEAGHTTDFGHQVADLVHHIGDLMKDGQLSAAGQAMLAGPLAALQRLSPLEQ